MSQEQQHRSKRSENVSTTFFMAKMVNCHDMSKEDRKEQLLEVLVDMGGALPPSVLWRNARFRGARFARRTTTEYLRELREEGYVNRVDPAALEDRRIETMDGDGDGYWLPTDAGRQRIENTAETQ
jgi:hypothetical protein